MRFKYIKDEKNIVEVYCNERTTLVNQIEQLVNNSEFCVDGVNCYGYLENDIVPLAVNEIQRFYVEDDKTYAAIENKKYQIKMRLYQIEETLKDQFVKINKSSIVNISYIKKFSSDWSGYLLVEMKNGDKDYISRRQLKVVKERMGL